MVKKISEYQQEANDLRVIHKDKLSTVLNLLVKISAFVTMTVLVIMIAYILITGIPNITLDQFALEYNTDNVSMMPAIINTLLYTVLSLLIALPLGIGSAIYLVEYAKKGSKFVEIVRLTTETLSGIPSIIFGLFGYLFLCIFCGLGYSLLSGVITLSIIILPLIIFASPVLKIPAPTTKSPTIIMTTGLENPESASSGVSTPVSRSASREPSATTSERILPLTNNIQERASTMRVIADGDIIDIRPCFLQN